MSIIRSFMLSLLALVLVTGCASVTREETTAQSNRGLVGAWIVTASRPAGVGKNLLTFSSDGTFFRSGDTHPLLSGAHGAWKRVGDKEFDATYMLPWSNTTDRKSNLELRSMLNSWMTVAAAARQWFATFAATCLKELS